MSDLRRCGGVFYPFLRSSSGMLPEKTEAVVIRHVDFSETSKVVTLFTRDFGKISALAQGARRLRGPFEAALDLLC